MTSSKGSCLIKVLLGLSLVLMGCGGTGWLWYTYQKAEETRHWQSVEAVVISSQMLTDRPTPHSPLYYRAEVHYRYTVDDKTYTGTRLGADGPSNKTDRALENVKNFAVGKTVTCYVDPADHTKAILKHAPDYGIYSIWFPLLFVVGGFGMIVSAFFRPKTTPGVTPTSMS
jgi:hypothetical protein